MGKETKVKLGGTVEIRLGKKSKEVQAEKVEPERRYGPPPPPDDLPFPKRQILEIGISDISTLYLSNNRTNNGSVMELEFGRAVIGSTLPSARLGDTYGDSLSEFNETTIAESNDRILNFLDSGGG